MRLLYINALTPQMSTNKAREPPNISITPATNYQYHAKYFCRTKKTTPMSLTFNAPNNLPIQTNDTQPPNTSNAFTTLIIGHPYKNTP